MFRVAKTTGTVNFQVRYQICFKSKFSVEMYRKIKNESIETEKLVGHRPLELSSLIFHIPNTEKNSNTVIVEVKGKRKQEV